MTSDIKQRIAQIQRGEVPEGYKIEQHAIIPSEWRRCKLGDIGEVLMCKRIYANQTSQEGEIPFYKIGTFGKNADAYITRSLYEKYKESYPYPQKGDVLISAAGTLGRIVVYDGNEAYFQDSNIVWLEVDKNIISNEYLSLCYQIIEWPIPEGGTIQRLYNGMIRKTQISIPLLSEQKNIVTIIAAQDKIIELKEKLLAEKQQQKKYLMQQLLTGKKRLPGFSDKWRKVRLHQIVERLTRRNTVGNRNVLTISAQFGLINQGEFFNKTVASDDKSNYFLLEKGDFAYNKSYSNGYPFGAIKRLSLYDNGIVSPLYICFHMLDNKNSAIYLEQYFEAGLMNREIQAFAQEGARNHGLLNISVEDFFNSKIQVPTLEEQTAIAEVLSTADHEIDLLQKDIEQEKQKKKALMQLLLTGIVRAYNE